MGFYYGPNQPPPEPDEPTTLREALIITWVVFTILAKPLGMILGTIGYLFLIFMLFGAHPAAGGIALALPFLGLVIWAVWEWRHPPEIQ